MLPRGLSRPCPPISRITLFQATRYEPRRKPGSDQRGDLRFRESIESFPKPRIKGLIRSNCARISPRAVRRETHRQHSDWISHRGGVVIEHLLLFFIRFRTVPMATDGGVSQPPHLQVIWFHNRAKTQKAPREKRGAFLFPSARADRDPRRSRGTRSESGTPRCAPVSWRSRR